MLLSVSIQKVFSLKESENLMSSFRGPYVRFAGHLPTLSTICKICKATVQPRVQGKNQREILANLLTSKHKVTDNETLSMVEPIFMFSRFEQNSEFFASLFFFFNGILEKATILLQATMHGSIRSVRCVQKGMKQTEH